LNQESLLSNLNVLPLQNLVMELDECNEESLLGGICACEDILRRRLTDRDVSTQALASHSGIRSIPTLMV
jgi:hypothetical protein